MSRKNLLWLGFAVFVFCALYFGWHENLFTVRKPIDAGKYVFWAAFAAFTAYSIYCSSREDLFKTLGTMAGLHWGRQIGLDLYIGISISAFLIYLHSGSALVVLLWLVPLIAGFIQSRSFAEFDSNKIDRMDRISRIFFQLEHFNQTF